MTRALDPVLERQVETIRNMTSSYIEIVSKTTRDLVPKAVMYIVVNKVCCWSDQQTHTHTHTPVYAPLLNANTQLAVSLSCD